jgi:dCMP deaminase
MRRVYQIAERSTDRTTNNGAVLVDEFGSGPTTVLVEGVNSHLPGYGDVDAHHERPLKYSLTEHAERAVIYEAARLGVRTAGLTMVANWVACPDCARGIVLPKIFRVICHKQCMDRTPPRWDAMVSLGLEMLESNTLNPVEVTQWDGEVGQVKNLNNGEIWCP